MMNLTEILAQFFVVAITAVAAENAVFSRALTTSRQLLFAEKKEEILLFGGIVTAMTTLSGMISFLVNYFGRPAGVSFHLRAVGFVAGIALVYIGTSLYLREKQPELYKKLKSAMGLAAFNSAVLGSLLLSALQNYSFLNTLGYGLGTGVGLTLAVILVQAGRRNLELSQVPRAFRGLPITLVYIGILSLAVYGLVGHQLPA